MLGRYDDALRSRRNAYSGYVKLLGKEHEFSLVAASNYAFTLINLQRFEESKTLLREMMPVARRVLGENNSLTLKMRRAYGEALYKDPGATLDDLREAVETLEDAERIARRVLGGAHPVTTGIEEDLRVARAALRARGGSFQRASEEKLRMRRVVSVADRFRRSAGDK